jgi:hypothetical protein
MIFGPLIRMLASESDGEALAAVRALDRRLKADGKDWHWLADRADARSIYDRPDPDPSWWRRPAPEPTPAPVIPMDLKTAFTMVRFVEDRRHYLPEDDSEWIQGLRARFRVMQKATVLSVADYKRLGKLFRETADKPEFG